MTNEMTDAEHPRWMESLWIAVDRKGDGALPARRHAAQEDVDSLLAAELNQLSLLEREQHFEQLHGIIDIQAIEETPELITEKLTVLETEIQVIPTKPAYAQAWHMNRCYVEDPKFRLMFLRADRYDAKKAARRLVLFMEKKRQFFGEDSMVRSLSLKDLNDDDIATVKMGSLQILPIRDRAGRMVLSDVHLTGPRLFRSDDSVLKIYIYIIMCAIEEDEDTQKLGLINLMYYLGPLRHKERRDPNFSTEIAATDRWLPFRSAGIHMCCYANSTALKVVFRILTVITLPEKRLVMRLHEGTHTEVQYSLMAFGIPKESMMVNSDGKVKTGAHRKWLAHRREKEMNCELYGNNFGKVHLPTTRDVLLGKGKPIQDHRGNVRVRALVEHMTPEYRDTTKAGKTKITWQVVHLVKKAPGRFLRKDEDDWWVEVPDKDARDKVGKLFMSSQTAMKQQEGRRPIGGTTSIQPTKRLKLERDSTDGQEAIQCFGCCGSGLQGTSADYPIGMTKTKLNHATFN